MKKIFSFLIALLFIPLMLVGCETSNEFKLTSSEKGECNFFGEIVNDVSGLSSLVNEDEYVSSLNDPYVLTEYSTRAWPTINKCNAEISFALTCVDSFKLKKSAGFYDLSLLSNTQSNLLKNFYIYFDSKTADNKTYTYHHDLTGQETDELNLPVSKQTLVSKSGATIGELVDSADNVIKTWGNKIKFSYSVDNAGRDNVKVETVFEFPENNFTDTQKYKYNSDTNTITYVYEDKGTTYSKVVAFNSVNGVVRKLVTKYKGDLIQNSGCEQYNTAGSQYEYSLEMGEDATLNIFGTYKILYQKDKSYIYCEHSNLETNKTYKTEYYVTTTGEIFGRFYESTTYVRNYDLFVNCDKMSGNLKARRASVAPSSEHIANTPLISEDSKLTSTYATKNDGDALSKYKTYIYYYSLGETLEYVKVAN